MSDAPTALPPLPLGVVGRALHSTALALAVIGGLGVVGLMVIINADVVGRGFFGAPVPATAEIVSASIVSIVFLQLPYATASGRNIRSDMLLGRVRARSARLGDGVDALHHLLGTLMLAVLLRYVWPEAISAIEEGETVGLYGVFTMPRWPYVVAVLAGCCLTLAHFALLTLGYAIRAARPAAPEATS